MTISDWIEIALDIKDNYNNYDGFVVIHGTDTMAYSVSALSFMLENLGKSVVFTGSQVIYRLVPLLPNSIFNNFFILSCCISQGSILMVNVTVPE